MMSDVKREMEIMSCWQMNGKKRALVPLIHQSLKSAVNCGVQLRAANRPFCYVY